MREHEMLKVNECIRVKSFVEASKTRYICKLKITSGSKKKLCENSIGIRHSIKELLAKNNVAQPFNY